MASDEAEAVPNPQENSLLFQRLPQELRDTIFAHLFASTRLTWGSSDIIFGLVINQLRPAPDSLAVLYTCRRARAEIGREWLSHVLFNFTDAAFMLRVLLSLPPGHLGLVRRVRVVDEVEMRLPMGILSLSGMLGLLEGLRLDVLTVVRLDAHGVYRPAMQRLIECTQGWRELRYIHRYGYRGGFVVPWRDRSGEQNPPKWFPRQQYDDVYSWYVSELGNWRRLLGERDGAEAGSSVRTYLARCPNEPGGVLEAGMRDEVSDAELLWTGGTGGEGVLAAMPHHVCDTEVMVVARRGAGVDYVARRDASSKTDMNVRDFMNVTWSSDLGAVERDSYDDAEDFE